MNGKIIVALAICALAEVPCVWFAFWGPWS
jgi:hypothetical protein